MNRKSAMSGRPHGSVDGEEAQARRRDAEQVAVRVRHQLVRLLARCVQAHRVIDVVGLLERQARVAAVDARAAGIDQVLDRVVAAGLEDVEEAGDIRLGALALCNPPRRDRR